MLSPLQDYAATIEALIFASDRPLRGRELIVHLPENMDLAEVIAAVALRMMQQAALNYVRLAMAGRFAPKSKLPKD